MINIELNISAIMLYNSCWPLKKTCNLLHFHQIHLKRIAILNIKYWNFKLLIIQEMFNLLINFPREGTALRAILFATVLAKFRSNILPTIASICNYYALNFVAFGFIFYLLLLVLLFSRFVFTCFCIRTGQHSHNSQPKLSVLFES